MEWKHAIGPGYSGVTVAAGRAVSAFSDGTNDVLAAWFVSDGRELWRTEIGATYRGHDGSTDGPVGTATLTDEAVLYDLKTSPEGVKLSERWRSAAFKKSVAIAVAAGNHLYGFSGTFLTCVSLASGDTVWKSRTPRGRGLILVDDSLVILGSGGVLTIVKAVPAGYREMASLVVSDHGGYTSPSFADGRIFVRNRAEIASVATRAADSGEFAQAAVPKPNKGDFA